MNRVYTRSEDQPKERHRERRRAQQAGRAMKVCKKPTKATSKPADGK